MNLTFARKEPNKAYVADRLWLPKTGIRLESAKNALEFTVNGQRGQMQMKLWEESQNHLICPREFIPAESYIKYKFPFVDLRPSFQKVEFKDLVVPRDEEQEKATDALFKNDNGILVLACGKGKTKLALKKIAQRQVPTLVVVPDGGIMEQWKESIFGNKKKGLPAGLEFDGELGIIQGPVFDWAKPITLALVTTLWMRIEQGKIPEEMFRYFGMVVFDEVHQIGAPKFSLTASRFYGDRIGLTATVEREDGQDPIYRYHIGEPFYSDLTQEIVPDIYFQQTPAVVDCAAAEVNGQANISTLRTAIGRSLSGNTFRYWSIKQALDAGRKILCISHSLDQLKLFHAMFPESAIIHGKTPKNERMEILRNSRICFAISKLGSTGVDDDALDTLFWLTPFRSKNALQQGTGRIQRKRAGKKSPIMVVFEDWMNPPLKRLCQSLKSSLKSWRYPFETVRPEQLSQDLPVEVKAAYDRAFKALPSRGDSAESVEEDDE